MMRDCWMEKPLERPNFTALVQRLEAVKVGKLKHVSIYYSVLCMCFVRLFLGLKEFFHVIDSNNMVSLQGSEMITQLQFTIMIISPNSISFFRLGWLSEKKSFSKISLNFIRAMWSTRQLKAVNMTL